MRIIKRQRKIYTVVFTITCKIYVKNINYSKNIKVLTLLNMSILRSKFQLLQEKFII